MAPIRDFVAGLLPPDLRRWVARREPGVLFAILAGTLFLLAFAKFAEEVLEGDTRAFDERLLLLLRDAADPSDPLGPRWFEEMMRDFSALGGAGVLALVALSATCYLAIIGRRRDAFVLVVSVLSGILLSQTLKWGFDRPRPDLVPQGMGILTHSFPSGHATMSALVYLTLGALLARTEARRRAKTYIVAVATVLAVLVGASRVYLGVHWPTDVVAGWALGAGWALLSWLVIQRLQRDAAVDPGGAAQPVPPERESGRM
jgi:undecaprenyl-diphosphatase